MAMKWLLLFLFATISPNPAQGGPLAAKFLPQDCGFICFYPRDEEFTLLSSAKLVVYRMEFPDMLFTPQERTFDYLGWYNTTNRTASKPGVLGSFIQQNSRGAFQVIITDVDNFLYTAEFNHSELMSRLEEEVQRQPDEDPEQLYFEAVTNHALWLIPDRTLSLYDTFIVIIPQASPFQIAKVGKGLAIAGTANAEWRAVTQTWGSLFGIKPGGLLRLPVGNSAWAAIAEGDSISAMGYMPGITPQPLIHWPAHEKWRLGWYKLGIHVAGVMTNGIYRVYAHNRYFNRTLATMPRDGSLALKIGPYQHTWFVSYNDLDSLPVGATLYLTTPDVMYSYLLINPNPDVDACPTCPSGWNCSYCTNMNATIVALNGATYDAGYFSIATLRNGADSLGNKYIDVNITFSTEILCPLPDYYGSDCETPCWGGVDKCGEDPETECKDGPTGSGSCQPCPPGLMGYGCEEDDYCDVDNFGPRNPLVGLASFQTPRSRVELASNFAVVGRETKIEGVQVAGRYTGTGVKTPQVVFIGLYNNSDTLPGSVIWAGNVTHGNMADISLDTPRFYDSLDLNVRLSPDHPLTHLQLVPGYYFISVVPLLGDGEHWITDSVAAGLQYGLPDAQMVDNGPWETAKNVFTRTYVNTTSRIKVNMNGRSCKEYFVCKPDMKVLLIRMQWPDLALDTPDVEWGYNAVFGTGGVFSTFLGRSSQGHCTMLGHTVADNAKYYLTPVLTSSTNFNSLVTVAFLNDPTYRDTLFQALQSDTLLTVHAAGIDPDTYDVHFGFFPAFGNNQVLQRPYATTKGVWIPEPSTVKINSIINAFGTVLDFLPSWFVRPVMNESLQDVIPIPGGASVDAMGWSWLNPTLANDTILTDYNAYDKFRKGWISEEEGLVILDHTADKVTLNLSAFNNANTGTIRAVFLTEDGTKYGWWLQYYDVSSEVLNVGVSVIFSNGLGRSTFIDATPTTDKCPGCDTGVEDLCLVCDLQNTTVVPGVHYFMKDMGYFSVYVGNKSMDSSGPYLPITITFSLTDECPLVGHFGAGCDLQCPGGMMDACSSRGQCSTGIQGNGQCECPPKSYGYACQGDNACATSYVASPLHANSQDDLFLDSFVSVPPEALARGPVADFATLRPVHLAGITFWGRAVPAPWGSATGIYRPHLPQMVQVTFFTNDDTRGVPGAILIERNISDPTFITMDPGPQLWAPSGLTKIHVSFDPFDDINRYTLWPGKYWVQILVEDSSIWQIAMTDDQQQGNYPDLYWDRNDTMDGSQWQQAKDLGVALPHLEVMFELHYDHCNPQYKHLGVPLPRPNVTTYQFMDFQPKRAMAGETVTFTFSGYIPNGAGQISLVKIADTRHGYGCWGEAPGGEARPLPPNKKVVFTMSVPGVYSVCIKTQYDLDWEEMGRGHEGDLRPAAYWGFEDLVVYPLQPLPPLPTPDNFYGYSTCEQLLATPIAKDYHICGCIYDQPGPSQVPMVLPLNFPYSYMTAGEMPILVRQGCCTFITDEIITFPFVDEEGNPTDRTWMVCVNFQPVLL